MSAARAPWTYRERLRREGYALAACGAVGSAVLLLAVDAARENPWSSVVQLAILAALLGWLGPRSVRRWSAEAAPVAADAAGSGEPTPLWQLPLICAGLALLVGWPTGAWDASLRVTAGCVLVGLAQAVLLDRTAAAQERRLGGELVRIKGSRVLKGTRLAVLHDSSGSGAGGRGGADAGGAADATLARGRRVAPETLG
jgi:hypothetical protein